MTKRDKDFLSYLIDLAEKANDSDSDSCTLSVERNGILFKCNMTFEIYKIYEKEGEQNE
ncbi:MAG: hypothetical protein J6S67_24745 [Methanobrevibacter sp.]|nr:hypothetical protein [Methanobrevibacter sp.]